MTTSRKLLDTITREQAAELVSYDPETGILTWKKCHFPNRVGKEAGGYRRNSVRGYRYVWLCGRRYSSHRIAWLLMTGKWPVLVDHINRDPGDNRWANLREATESQQRGNTYLVARNTSGVRGVRWYAKRQRWYAAISFGQKSKYLGSFKTKEEAVSAYDKAAREHWGEFYMPATKRTSVTREGAR